MFAVPLAKKKETKSNWFGKEAKINIVLEEAHVLKNSLQKHPQIPSRMGMDFFPPYRVWFGHVCNKFSECCMVGRMAMKQQYYLNICRGCPLIFRERRHPVNPSPPAAGRSFISPNGAWGAPPRWSHALCIIFPGCRSALRVPSHVGWSPLMARVSFTRSEALQWEKFLLKSSLVGEKEKRLFIS